MNIRKFFTKNKNNWIFINSKKLDKNKEYLLYDSLNYVKKSTKIFYGLTTLFSYNFGYVGYCYFNDNFSIENNLDSLIIGFSAFSLFSFIFFRNLKTVSILKVNPIEQKSSFGIKNIFNNNINYYEIKNSKFNGIYLKNGLFKIGIMRLNHKYFSKLYFYPRYIINDDYFWFKEILDGKIVNTDMEIKKDISHRNIKKYGIFK